MSYLFGGIPYKFMGHYPQKGRTSRVQVLSICWILALFINSWIALSWDPTFPANKASSDVYNRLSHLQGFRVEAFLLGSCKYWRQYGIPKLKHNVDSPPSMDSS